MAKYTKNLGVHKSLHQIKFIDLFCGIGGFRIAAQNAAKALGLEATCVFSSDIDKYARESYRANFGEYPMGDITKISEQDVPGHDLLLAGFPCQAFSIMGSKRGFEDTRGTLFFEIARILKCKKPKAFVLENVKQLKGHNNGKTLDTIINTLKELGYNASFQTLNALDFGLPQKRERIFIVGIKDGIEFKFPSGDKEHAVLESILEKEVELKYYASEHITAKRKKLHTPKHTPSIWHENKSGNISSHTYSCALRASASYNYLLVNGERRLTPREMVRLQGFPDSFKIVVSDFQIAKQAGNSLPITVAQKIIEALFLQVYNRNLGSY